MGVLSEPLFYEEVAKVCPSLKSGISGVTINHMLERGSKVFSCFLDVRKAFDTVWIDGLLFKLFSDLGINGRMWLALKDLFCDIKARVLFSGSL